MSMEVLKRPIYTEKAVTLSEQLNKYSFEVVIKANKIMVHHAVESRFNVHVKDVKIINMKGKVKRTTIRSGGRVIRTEGQRKNWKKAIVTLIPGDTIDLVT